MSDKYYLGDTSKMSQRESQKEEFCNSVLNYSEVPDRVTDESSLNDFFSGDKEALIEKVKRQYGILMNSEHFTMPFWQFLDWIEENKTKSS